MLEEALDWEFRDLGFSVDSIKRFLSGFGELLKPLWKSVRGGGWNRLSPSLPSLSCWDHSSDMKGETGDKQAYKAKRHMQKGVKRGAENQIRRKMG